jgi:hypothetical protein
MNKEEEICWLCWIVAAVTALGVVYLMLEWLTSPARAHDHWIKHGGYLASTDKALDPYPNACCGHGDCFIQPFENIKLSPEGFYFPANHPEARKHHRGYFVSREEAKESKDGQYWACFNTYDWTVKCFFFPVNV